MRFLRKIKILIPSLIAMFITIGMGTTVVITYAWNTANRDVISDGETVNANFPIVVLASDTYNPSNGETTITYSSLEDNGFGTTINFSPTNVLYPSTSYDGVNFRYATNVDTNGQALQATGDIDTYEAIDSIYERYFFLEKTFYLVSAYTSDITIYLSNVDFLAGTEGSSLYKAIRLCVEVGNRRVIISDNDGLAYPANGAETIASSDPAIRESNINRNTFTITLPAMVNAHGNVYDCTPVKVTLRIWIEGQSNYAVVAYSGHAFKVNLDFDLR